MAQLVLAAAGSALGAATITGTVFGLSGAALGWMAGGMLGSLLVKGPKSESPMLNDLRVTGVGYGQPVPWIAGTVRNGGTLIWASKRRPIKQVQKSGKGGGSTYTSYTYRVDLLYMLSENEIGGVSKVHKDGELVWNGKKVKSGVWGAIRVYTGDADQLPDPAYEAAIGAGYTPAHRGRGTVFLEDVELDSSGRIPNFSFFTGGVAFNDMCFGAPTVAATYSVTGEVCSYDNNAGTFWTGVVGSGGTTTIESILYRTQEFTFRKYRLSDGTLLDTVVKTVYMSQTTNVDPVWYDAKIVHGLDEPKGLLHRRVTVSGNVRAVSMSETPSAGFPVTSGISAFRGFINFAGGFYWACHNTGGVSKLSDTAEVAVYTNAFYSLNGVIQDAKTGRLYANRVLASSLQVDVSEFIEDPFDPLWSHALGPTSTAGSSSTTGFHVFANKIANINGTFVRILRVGPDGVLGECGAVSVGGGPVNVWGVANTFVHANGRLVDMNIPLSSFLIGSEVALQVVVAALLERAGLTDQDFDVTGIDEDTMVSSFFISQVGNTRSALEQLAVVYDLTFAKTDKIYVMQRKYTADKSIGYAEIGWSDSPGGVDNPLPIVQGNPTEMEAQIFLRFRNMSRDFEPDVAQSDKLLQGQKSSGPIDIPIGLYPSEAQHTVERILAQQSYGLWTYGPFRLSLEHADVMPGDVLSLTDHAGRAHMVDIVERTDMGLMLEFKAQGSGSAPRLINWADDTDQGQTEIQSPSTAVWVAGDWPLMRDVDDVPGWYALMAGAGDGSYWPGGILARSWDGNQYTEVANFLQAGTFGTCLSTLPDWAGGNCFDEASTLTVELYQGELSSSTVTAMINDLTTNVMMVGAECIRFRRAELIAERTYRLTGLIRGFRGTEWAIGLHEADEVCALVDGALQPVAGTTGTINQERQLKGVTFGLSLASVTAQTFTDTGVRLKPFSPAFLIGLANEDGDIVLEWDRRTRRSYSYGGVSGVVAPLGEAFERYRVRVLDGPDVKRSTDVSDVETWTYTSAMAAEDGFSTSDTVRFEVMQLSEIVGDGYLAELERTIP